MPKLNRSDSLLVKVTICSPAPLALVSDTLQQSLGKETHQLILGCNGTSQLLLRLRFHIVSGCLQSISGLLVFPFKGDSVLLTVIKSIVGRTGRTYKTLALQHFQA